MAMNFRNVNDLETVSKLNSGDKLLVNSGGVAKQVDARKFLATGGGKLLNAFFSENDGRELNAVITYESGAPMTYEDLKESLTSGPVLIKGEMPGLGTGYTTPLSIALYDNYKIVYVYAFLGETPSPQLVAVHSAESLPND